MIFLSSILKHLYIMYIILQTYVDGPNLSHFIFSRSSRFPGPQFEQGSPDSLFPSHLHQWLWGNPQTIQRYNLFSESWVCFWPQLGPLDMKEQRLYLEPLPESELLIPSLRLSQGALRRNQLLVLAILSFWSLPTAHTVGECWNTERAVNESLALWVISFFTTMDL